MEQAQVFQDKDTLIGSPGWVLRHQFMIPSGMDEHDMSEQLGVSDEYIKSILNGSVNFDGVIDGRLCNLFNLPKGWWIRIQDQYYLLLQKQGIDI